MRTRKFTIDLGQQTVAIEYSDGQVDTVPYSHELMHGKIDDSCWLDFLGDNPQLLKGADDPFIEQVNYSEED